MGAFQGTQSALQWKEDLTNRKCVAPTLRWRVSEGVNEPATMEMISGLDWISQHNDQEHDWS